MTKEALVRGRMVRDESGHSEETERILRDWPLSDRSTKCVDPFDEIRRNSLPAYGCKLTWYSCKKVNK
ncbi:MAG: hypothetical protein ACE5HO_19225 [bacterium]